MNYSYPKGTTREVVEAFEAFWGSNPNEDIRLGSSFEAFLKGYLSGRFSTPLGMSQEFLENYEDLKARVEDLERWKESSVSYDSYGNYARNTN